MSGLQIIPLEDLLDAINDFHTDSLNGLELKDGIIAIKLLMLAARDREFIVEMETIVKIKHGNLVLCRDTAGLANNKDTSL